METTTMTTETSPAVFIAALAAWVAYLNTSMEAHWAARGFTATRPVFSIDTSGRKFLRIVRTESGSRSAYAFVEAATGQIWKADGWKGPARNFPRGSVYDLANAPSGVTGL